MTGEFLNNKDNPSCYVNLVFITFFFPISHTVLTIKLRYKKISGVLTFNDMVSISDIKLQKLSELCPRMIWPYHYNTTSLKQYLYLKISQLCTCFAFFSFILCQKWMRKFNISDIISKLYVKKMAKYIVGNWITYSIYSLSSNHWCNFIQSTVYCITICYYIASTYKYLQILQTGPL